MNVIFCTSPFQVLLAREVARHTNLEFCGMYLLMSDDSRQKMKDFCKEVCVLPKENLLEILKQFLFGKRISSLFLASLYNTITLSFFNFRKSTYEEVGGYQEGYDGFEDWHLWARMVTKENALVLNLTTAYYRFFESYQKEMTFRARLAKTREISLEEALEGEVR